MIGKLKRLVQKHLILAYVLAYLIIIGEFVCMAYLVYINSDKMIWLGMSCILTAWVISVTETTNEDEEVRQEAYTRIIRKINRLN